MSEADREKWNEKWSAARAGFAPHPLAEAALAAGIPEGEVLELAAGPSGIALRLAAAGRKVLAVDVSDVALRQLEEEAAKRGLADDIHVLCADLETWTPPADAYALVIALRYWDPAVFAAAAAAVEPGGLLAWETFTLAERRYRPTFSERFCLGPDEPVLPAGFTELVRADLDDGRAATRRLLARRSGLSTLDSRLSTARK